ncbi:hypothetical protein DPMN_079003 [Dreissena polymorpha]|uniref:B box-type domain-containing protein n=2 Tax=Dreissena polymorpha TaxID=45954 RepID=A0A9D4BQX6_DREPO|nr:hypothetical protein DPMN_079003 [Dreissena polymorpha]
MTCGREDIKKWPVSKAVEDFLRKCEVHEDETLTQFCHDHSQLCCSACVGTIHSQCSKVTPINELTNTQPTDLQGLSVKLETVLGEIKSLQISQEASVESLQKTYKEQGAVMIEQMRGNLNTYIDECDNNYVGTSGGNEHYLKEEMCRNVVSIVNEFDNITVKELNEMKDEVLRKKVSIARSFNKFTDLQNDLKTYYYYSQKIEHKGLCFIASMKCERKLQQALTLLDKSGNMFTLQGKSLHKVRIPSDTDSCHITAICVLPEGQVLIADFNNKKVKLLDKQYRMVSHCGVNGYPHDICQIKPSAIAVTVEDFSNPHEVQFITVTQSQLVPARKFQLKHKCICIAHHQGALYISSGTALYKYSMRGKLLNKVYENISHEDTVDRCAVSPAGNKLYITNPSQHKLLTLARDGTILATFTDPELRGPLGLHVTPAGQVLVCGFRSSTILQVDREGFWKLDTLATQMDGVVEPWSVCYSSTTSSILVGQWWNNKFLVFTVE